jgi:hypothetical protein
VSADGRTGDGQPGPRLSVSFKRLSISSSRPFPHRPKSFLAAAAPAASAQIPPQFIRWLSRSFRQTVFC